MWVISDQVQIGHVVIILRERRKEGEKGQKEGEKEMEGK